MSRTERATIIILAGAVVAVWSMGVWAALRSRADTGQNSTAGSAVPEARAEATSVIANATWPATAPATDLTPAVTPTSTASPIPTASSAATNTQVPPPVLSPTGEALPSPAATMLLPGVGTPVVPQYGRFLLVIQDEQKMHAYQDGAEIRVIAVSSGRPVRNEFTPAWSGKVGRYLGSGPFLNTNLWSDHMWYLFPAANGSILIHSVPYTKSGETIVYDRLDALGVEPASRGCVRISPEDAEWLKGWDPVGVPIQITPWSGPIGPADESP